MSGLLAVVSGPSGSGKSTLCKKLLETADLNFGLVISHTSRAMRKTEVEGRDYFFQTRESFIEKKEQGYYLEWAEVHGNFYGTPRDQVDQLLASGQNVLLEIDVQGGIAVQKLVPEVVLIFVAPPRFEVLEKRLRSRGTDGEEIIQKRIKNAVEELHRIPEYGFLVVNDQLSKAMEELKSILISEKNRISRLHLQNFYDILSLPKL